MNLYLEGEKYGELTIIGEKPLHKGRRVVVTKCNCGHISDRRIGTISTNIKDGITNYCGLLDKHRQITGISYRDRNKRIRELKKELYKIKENINKRKELNKYIEQEKLKIEILKEEMQNERIKKNEKQTKFLSQSLIVLIGILVVGLIFLFTVGV